MVDILVIKKDNILSYQNTGSPAGEVSRIISTPEIEKVDFQLYEIADSNHWDVIVIDINFLGIQESVHKIKEMLPCWKNCPQFLVA